MNIGNIKIKGKLFLAPMSGVTNLPFRLLCKKYGASMTYTEMINCDAYLMENKKTQKRVYFLEEERPIGIQIFGSSVEKLTKSAKKIEKELKPDFIDFNIGCPAYDVMKIGGGAALLEDSEKIKRIIKELSSSISIPLTCKIRILKNDEKTIEIAKIIEKNGAKALTIHGRTAKQGYSGRANWNIIKKIKQELRIPVILNGDIIDEESAKKAFEETGCDAIMIGRAAMGNPYLFKRIQEYLNNCKILKKQSRKEILDLFLDFLNLSIKHNYKDINFIKLQARHFTKNLKYCKEFRRNFRNLKTIEEVKKEIEIFLN